MWYILYGVACLLAADVLWCIVQQCIWAIEPETLEHQIPLDIADAIRSLKRG